MATPQTLWNWPLLAVGAGNVENIGAVRWDEAKEVIETAQSGVRVTEDSAQKLVLTRTDAGSTKNFNTSGGTALTKFGYSAGVIAGTTGSPTGVATTEGKTEGIYAAALSLEVTQATSRKADEFNLRVLKSGVLQRGETFPNLTMGAYSGGALPTDERYAPTIFNHASTGSKLLQFLDSLVHGTPADRRPANGTYTLSGGNDGLTGLDDNDFIGSDAGDTGLYSFDTESDLRLLAVPGRGDERCPQRDSHLLRNSPRGVRSSRFSIPSRA